MVTNGAGGEMTKTFRLHLTWQLPEVDELIKGYRLTTRVRIFR